MHAAVENIDLDWLDKRISALKALANKKRLCIAFSLRRRPLTFTEIYRTCRFNSKGELAFHLASMKGIIEKTRDGRYRLTSLGEMFVQVLQELEPPNTSIEEVPATLWDKVGLLTALAIGLSACLISAARGGVFLHIISLNVFIILVFTVVYVKRYYIIKHHPYLVNMPAFTYLLGSTLISPRRKGEYINKIFRVNIFASLTFSAITLVEAFAHSDVVAGYGQLAAILLLAATLLYYKRLYGDIKEHMGR